MIDVHTHVVPSPESLANLPRQALRLEANGDAWDVVLRGELVRTVPRATWDPHARLQWMDIEGIERHVLSPTPFLFLYDAPMEVCETVGRVTNQWIADMVKMAPGRFYGLGTVPLQEPAEAVRELRFIHETLGLDGVEIGTHTRGFELGDPSLKTFFETANDLGSVVFIHPWESRHDVELSWEQYWLGYPTATAAAFGALHLADIPRRYPRLRIVLAHGGGCTSSVLGRLHQAELTLSPHSDAPGDPMETLRSCWLDSLVYDAASVAHLLTLVGPERVLLGTDFPFVARESPPGAAIDAAREMGLIDGAATSRLKRQNALELLGAKATPLSPGGVHTP